MAIRKLAVTYAGIPTRVLRVDGTGAPIVLLHGFTDSADSWRPLLRELEARGHTAIAPDLPEAGRAGRLPRGPVLPTLDAFVAAVIAAAGTGPVVAGNSLGGALALRAAATDTVRVRAVVPVAPAGFGFTARLERAAAALRRFDPVLRLSGQMPYPGWLVRDVAARFYALRFGLGRAEPELARRYAAHFRDGVADVRRVAAFGRQLSGELGDRPFDLERVKVPVVLVWGRHDAVCDIAGAQVALAALPQARLVVLEESGHLPQLQQSRELAEILSDATAFKLPRRQAGRRTPA